VFTRKTYETIIHLFLKSPADCYRPKEYRLAKFMIKMIPDLNFWKSIQPNFVEIEGRVTSLTYFLTEENKSLFLDEYKRHKRISKFEPDKLKEKSYPLEDDKTGEDSPSVKSSNKKLNLLNFIKHGTKKEN